MVSSGLIIEGEYVYKIRLKFTIHGTTSSKSRKSVSGQSVIAERILSD
jgi:hypothetical protein